QENNSCDPGLGSTACNHLFPGVSSTCYIYFWSEDMVLLKEFNWKI
ncbi:uncharacterized, partial [Lates japonicus]